MLKFWRNLAVWEWGLVLVFTVAAFLLRRYGLGTQSLWFDEADLIERSTQDLPTIFGTFLKAGENGPLYTLLMHFWCAFFGTSEASVRTPSLISGTFAIPMIFLVGKQLCNRWVGLVAAFLLTISPYNIWYSQDAKMYPLALFLSLGSIWLFLKAVQSKKAVWWVAYALVTTIGFYIHVMLALIVVVQLVYYWSRRDYWRTLDKKQRRHALIALGILTLPYLPIAVWQARALWDGTIGEAWFKPVGLTDMFNSLGRRFGVNRSIEPWETLGALTYASLAALGLAVLWISSSYRLPKPGKMPRSRFLDAQEILQQNPYLDTDKVNKLNPSLFLTVYMLVPVLTFYVLTTRIPLYADRYLLVASPAYYLLVAVALVWLVNKFLPLAALAAALAVTVAIIALLTTSYTTTPQKEDWRGAMKQLSEEIRAGDVVFVIPGYVESAVKYYFKPAIPVAFVTIPQVLLDGRNDPDLNAFIQNSIKGYERAWLVTSPERYELADDKFYVRTVWFDNNTRLFRFPFEKVGVKVYGYSFIQQPGTNQDFFPRTGVTNYAFGDALQLLGYDYRVGAAFNRDTGLAPAPEPGVVRQDDYLHLTLHWKALQPLNIRYAMTVRLTNQAGQDFQTSYDAPPLNGYFPTDKWKPNEIWRDYRDIYIKVPPGQYFLEVLVYPDGKPDVPLTVSGDEKGNTTQAAQKVRLAFPITVLPK